MSPTMFKALTVLVALAGVGLTSSGAMARQTKRTSLIDLLVWGTYVDVDVSAYPPNVRALINEHRRRYDSYQSNRVRPRDADSVMVYEAQVQYERRLVAASAGNTAALAAAYVDELQPCYEWEGFHHCPEHEAAFAAVYRRDHPGSPLGDY